MKVIYISNDIKELARLRKSSLKMSAFYLRQVEDLIPISE